MWFGRNVSIHPSAKIIEPVCLGDHCRIEAQVVIGPNVVLGPGVFVDQGTTIANSTVLEKTYLGRLVNIQDALVYRNILIKTDTGASAFIPDRFLLSGIEPGAWMEGLRRVLELFFALLLILVMLPLFLFSAVLSLLSRPKSWIVYEERLSSTMAELDASSLREPRAVRLPRFGCNPDNAPGKLLHRLGWDGLPMLFSIFQGHIALVGVGPLRPEQYAQVTEEWQRQRFLSLAGLTGLWYITSGSQASLDEQFVVDCYYAVTRNWKIDLDILWKTIPTWWRRVTA
jgi:lipopolysaccharide/colanic/teichoic acid biosynthesis glycosyltransferase